MRSAFTLVAFITLLASGAALAKDCPCEDGWSGMALVGSMKEADDYAKQSITPFSQTTPMSRCRTFAREQKRFGSGFKCFAIDDGNNCRAGQKPKATAPNCMGETAADQNRVLSSLAAQYARGQSSSSGSITGETASFKADYRNVAAEDCSSGCVAGFGAIVRSNFDGRACDNDHNRAFDYRAIISQHKAGVCHCAVNFVLKKRTGPGEASGSMGGSGYVGDTAN